MGARILEQSLWQSLIATDALRQAAVVCTRNDNTGTTFSMGASHVNVTACKHNTCGCM